VAAAYVIVGWLIMQIGDVMAPAMHLPDWINSALAFFLILGFPIALILSWAFEVTPEGVRLEKKVDRSKSITHLTGRKLDYWIIALLILAVGFFAFDKFVLDPQRDAERLDAAVEVARQADAELNQPEEGLSIAVLPFVNMSEDESNEYFSDGISEELLNVLARFPGLRVAARTSAFQFKGRNQDIADIARLLRVNHVLEGSVRKSGNRLRITAQLIEADSGFHLWSESYDREQEDIFAIQDEISAAIAKALQVELALADKQAGAGLPTVPAAASAQAYEYYLRGRQLINGRSRSGLEEAVAVLEHALELDETYAPAHAQLAIAIALLRGGGGTYGDLSMGEVLDRATPHIERANSLDPTLSEGFGARALLANINLEYLAAVENGRKSMALNPSYVDVINWTYLSLLNTGRWIEAMELIDYLISVDPLSIVGRINYAFALGRQRRFDEARRVTDGLRAQSPRNSLLTQALVSADHKGAITDSNRLYLQVLALDPYDSFSRRRMAVNFSAISLFEEARRMSPESAWLVHVYEQRWDEAKALAAENLAQDERNNTAKFNLANVLHMAGDLAEAQSIYEELGSLNPGFPLLDLQTTSPMATARMAYGAKALGHENEVKLALEELKADQEMRAATGVRESYVLRGAAMAAAIEDDAEGVVAKLKEAIDVGLRDHFIFREPAFETYTEHPGFQAQAARLDAILAEERQKTIRLICLENPATEVWQPLPETCDDVGQSAAR
jgi:TolB-like protein